MLFISVCLWREMFARDRSLSDSCPIDFKQLLSLRNLLTLRLLILTDTDTAKSATNAAANGLVFNYEFCLHSVTSNTFHDELPRCEPL